jgi:23S rRNA (cytosine1962-C5)-methyltransferase
MAYQSEQTSDRSINMCHMSLPVISLKPQKPGRRRHPWVYDNEIATEPDEKEFSNGGLVKVRDSQGRIQGVGFLNKNSRIAFRYLSRNPSTVIDNEFWRHRVKTAYDYRRARYRGRPEMPEAFRLIHGESDGFPGLVADVYGKFVVVQFLALGLETWRECIVSSIAEVIEAKGIYERSDSPIRALEGLDQTSGVIWGEIPPQLFELQDQGATILVDLISGAKTGLFLDQIENQMAAAREAKGRNVLNCFSYTGLFGLRAAVQGALSVTDIEISEKFNALNSSQWSKNNFSIKHEVVTANVFDHLRILDSQQYKTDMIILDPPAFTKNRSSREGAVRGYNEINRMAMRLLSANGVLVTCSCSHHLSMQEFIDIIYGASLDARREVKLIEQRTQPPDHPVSLDAPESNYLKCLILAVS